MKYVPPYGRENEGDTANYINGDPSVGRQGSIPPAAAFEHPMREIVGVIEKSYYLPSEEDLLQMCKSIRSQRLNYAEDTGSVNALSVAFDPPFPEYTIGLPIRVKVRGTNTGSATIDAGAGVRAIKKPTGAEVNAGDLPAGGLVDLVYDGTVFQMINFGGAAAPPAEGEPPPTTIENTYLVNIPYTVDTSPTANTIIADFSPAITSLVPGTLFMVKIANTNTSFTNINVNGLGNKPVNAQGGTASWPLLPCDMAAGDVKIFCYDGTHFWIYANDIITVDVTVPIANVADFNSFFRALGRKRIYVTNRVTIQLAAGVYAPEAIPPYPHFLYTYAAFITQHPNADCITVQGTMLAANPVSTDFTKNSSAQAAANNIAMLRSRYGTEVRIGNPPANTHYIGIQHTGPGKITFKDILVTGAQIFIPDGGTANAWNVAVCDGSAMTCIGVASWGGGGDAFDCLNGATMDLTRCFAVNAMHDGLVPWVGASMLLHQTMVYGNGRAGIYANMGSNCTLAHFPDEAACEVIGNGHYGVVVENAASIYLWYAIVTGNPIAAAANSGGAITSYGTVWGSLFSPALGRIGNGGAIITSN